MNRVRKGCSPHVLTEVKYVILAYTEVLLVMLVKCSRDRAYEVELVPCKTWIENSVREEGKANINFLPQ